MVEELGLHDIWREQNNRKPQFTFYSNRHKSWSRIDMIWITPELKIEVQETETETNIWAYHNPIKISWRGTKSKRKRWTLNVTILKDEEFIEKTKKEMEFYFKENAREETSPQMIRDAAKAYFRGLAITHIAKRNREKRQHQKLKEEYRILEIELQKQPQKKLFKNQMELIKHKLNLIESEEIAQQIKRVKQNFFQNANKSGRWLAYKL